MKNKSKQTCLDKYGVEYSWQADSIKQKIKHKSLELYGVENPGCSEQALKKIAATLQERYNVSSLGELLKKPVYSAKCKATCLEKYGVEHPS